jgi:hypothetical protein
MPLLPFLLARPWLLKVVGVAVACGAVVLFILAQRRAGAAAATAAIKLEAAHRALKNQEVRRAVEKQVVELGRADGDGQPGRSSADVLRDKWSRD